MTVGITVLELYFPRCHSLKEKRQVLRSIKAKLKNKFNVAVAEVGEQDRWQSAVLGISTLANEHGFVNEVLDRCVGLIRSGFPQAEIVHHHMELI